MQLGKLKEALEYAVAAQNIAPSNSQASERVLSIRNQLAAGWCLYYLYIFPFFIVSTKELSSLANCSLAFLAQGFSTLPSSSLVTQ